MGFLKASGKTVLILMSAAVTAVAVSAAAGKETGEVLFALNGMRVTVTGSGAAAAYLVWMLFAFLRIRHSRGKDSGETRRGERLDAAGFGILPAVAAWKIFEQATGLSLGKALFPPLGALPYITEGGNFAPSRIELILAAASFALLLAWLTARRQELPGNGDLLWSVLCIWGMIRAVTETFRLEPLLCAGNVNVMQILFMVLADAGFAAWTAIRGRKQKSAAVTAAEWAAVLACQGLIGLNAAGIAGTGSGIGDLAMTAGGAALCTALMLLKGKDSRG